MTRLLPLGGRPAVSGALLALCVIAHPPTAARGAPQAPPLLQECTFSVEERAAIARWLDGHAVGIAIPRHAPDDGQDAGATRMAEALERGSIIGLGEATHGSQEEQVVRFGLVRALVSAGKVSVIAIEANRLPSEALNRYIGGEPGDLARIMADPALFDVLRTDEFTRLLQWLRRWNSKSGHPRITLVGVDVQDPANELRTALAMVADGPDHDKVARLRQIAGPLLADEAAKLADWLSAATYAQHQEQLRNARALRDFIRAEMPRQRRALMLVENAVAGLEAFEYYPVDARSMAIPPDFVGRRDRAIARNVQAAAEQGRLVFLAHDTHVVAAPASYRHITAPSVGSDLRQKLGTQYVTVNFAWGTGAVKAIDLSALNSPGGKMPNRTEVRLPAAEEGDLAFLLKGSSAQSFWFRPDWLPAVSWGSKLRDCPMGRRWVGAAIDPAAWDTTKGLHALSKGTDLLVWIRDISPSL
ncbi:erythromycin esterase family protein [Porphyrobacter sp. YT40]|uniref:erythromycin esterase family protein n=1 Tax=Porphyrobacter sp. YT40 TaxID=2547601 RepID=UPI001144C42E|nr:erythromycin esterase family protein [Porphyrobacter sp. YT40]QDH33667.1 erythromycin esterase family protein [Porphyrobacter sp. YT40]